MIVSSRAMVMLGVLLGVALLLAVLVSLLPAEWQGGPSGIPAPFGARAPRDIAGTDGLPTPQTTPLPRPSGVRIVRTLDDPFTRGFDIFGIRRDSLGGFTVRLASLLTLVIAGMLILYLLPRRLGRIAAALRTGWRGRVRLGILGVAAALLVGALGVLSIIALAGTPIWLLVVGLSYFAALLGLVALSLPLGRWIGCRFGLAEQSPPIDLIAGLLGVFIVTVLPVVGSVLLLLAALLGLGAVLQTRAGSEQSWIAGLPDLEY